MSMRAGSYNAARPQWRGVIRDGSYPAYVCVHTSHATQPDATACARTALTALKAASTNETSAGTDAGSDTGRVLPQGWTRYQPGTPA